MNMILTNSTCKIFNIAYSLAKSNHPFVIIIKDKISKMEKLDENVILAFDELKIIK